MNRTRGIMAAGTVVTLAAQYSPPPASLPPRAAAPLAASD